MLSLYQRQVRKCRTTNQFNRLHIAISNRITPLELVELRKLIRNAYPFPDAKQWVARLLSHGRRSGKRDAEAFVRRRLKPNLYLYSSGEPASRKTLVICFTGNARRLMMPLPTFLQHLDASRFDVLLLSRHGETRYAKGVSGLANSFDELMLVLRTTLQGQAYKHVVAFGTSGGGVPAILAALYLGLDKGVAVGCSSFQSDRWKEVRNAKWLQHAKEGWKGKPQLLAVFSAGHADDKERATELAEALPVTLVPVPGDEHHGMLFNYVLAGTFREFLESLLTTAVGDARSGRASRS